MYEYGYVSTGKAAKRADRLVVAGRVLAHEHVILLARARLEVGVGEARGDRMVRVPTQADRGRHRDAVQQAARLHRVLRGARRRQLVDVRDALLA